MRVEAMEECSSLVSRWCLDVTWKRKPEIVDPFCTSSAQTASISPKSRAIDEPKSSRVSPELDLKSIQEIVASGRKTLNSNFCSVRRSMRRCWEILNVKSRSSAGAIKQLDEFCSNYELLLTSSIKFPRNQLFYCLMRLAIQRKCFTASVSVHVSILTATICIDRHSSFRYAFSTLHLGGLDTEVDDMKIPGSIKQALLRSSHSITVEPGWKQT